MWEGWRDERREGEMIGARGEDRKVRDEAKGEKARGKQYQMVKMRGEIGGGLSRGK